MIYSDRFWKVGSCNKFTENQEKVATNNVKFWKKWPLFLICHDFGGHSENRNAFKSVYFGNGIFIRELMKLWDRKKLSHI